ncbi:alpha/beta hydrolase [Streptomyces sp. NPDC002734]|uniref:alpha/beta hydrolase n=1 Tax=Streptomyces sp. NPDC002734 TaxID=3154426 RepID=UPI0033208B40
MSRSPRSVSRPWRAARLAGAVVTASALLLTACAARQGQPGDPGTRPALAALPAEVAPQLARFYEQKISWRSCGAPGFQCATVRAPLDYARPEAGEVRLAVSRTKATGPGRRLGSLFVNPGGPGGSAVDYLQGYAALGYPAEVRARYDMVAVDPRGVARSEPVECLDGPHMDTYTGTDFTPDEGAEADSLVEAFKTFAEGCGGRSAKVLRHVSTVETARDMDVVRAVLGDKELHYVGASYGTFLGATYAGLFPSRVGRLVLDGAMDPSLPARRLNLDQTAGFETAFQAFARDCVRQSDCPIGGRKATPAGVGRGLKAFFEKLDAEPLKAEDPDGRELTESLATIGVIAAMYDEGAWPQLREALDSARRHKDGTQLLALSDSYYERDTEGRYSNLMFANSAVNCLDLPAAFSSPEEVRASLRDFEKASPVFGETMAWSALNCAYWPVAPTGEARRIEAQGAAPILVVGTTRDPATPYVWAEALAGQLSSGRLLTHDGDGHTAYGRGSDCVDAAVDAYLLRGTVPPEGKRCL